MLARPDAAVELPGRIVGVARDYPTLVETLRSRAAEFAERRVPYLGVDIPTAPTLNLLEPYLALLGLAIVVTEDPDALRRISARLEKRHNASVRDAHARNRRKPRRIGTERARRLAELRVLSQSPRRRSQVAKRAAVIRWSDVKKAMADLKAKQQNSGPAVRSAAKPEPKPRGSKPVVAR